MTMNNETKLTTEQRIQRSIEHNEAKLQKAEEKRKPEILTNEDVRNYLAYLFNYPANQQRLQKLIADRKAQQAATE